MGDSTIGIKVADGSYYPILERGFTGRKRLVLTTAADNQPRVQIDLYRGNGSTLSQARYIGSLIIENIPQAAQGAPEIELFIGIDEKDQLSAEATDPSTGESESFATNLADASGSDELVETDFELGREGTGGFEEPALTGEDYKAGDGAPREERSAERRSRKGPSLILLVLFVVLGVLLVAAVAYFVYRGIQGPQAGPLSPTAAATTQQAVSKPAAQPAPAPAAAKPSAPEPAAAQPAAAEKQPAPAEAKPAAVSYLVKKGDTLWDLSSTYYRNPWLYPRLAKANGIKNPDLIFAGTRIVIPAN